jgi:hypothetical protein
MRVFLVFLVPHNGCCCCFCVKVLTEFTTKVRLPQSVLTEKVTGVCQRDFLTKYFLNAR